MRLHHPLLALLLIDYAAAAQTTHAGAGGLLDSHRMAQAKAAAKLRNAAVKRLAKCAALAEKNVGLALTVRAKLPAVATGITAN